MNQNKRSKIFHDFKQFRIKKDTRSMSEICTTGGETFNLQTHQLFFKTYMEMNPNWDRYLLYHKIGTGKTCTAITMSEEYMRQNNNKNKVVVILPARLKSNFIDELLSPCTFGKYISKEQPDVAEAKRRIEKSYDIVSINSFRSMVMKEGNANGIVEFIREYTKNKLFVIDEVHNFLAQSSFSTESVLMDLIESNTFKYTESKEVSNSIMLKLITHFASDSAKFIFMTATPIFNKISQFYELVSIMVQHDKIQNISRNEFLQSLNLLRGKVSYFGGNAENAFPNVQRINHEVPIPALSKEENQLVNTKNKGKVMAFAQNLENDSFKIKERQLLVSYVPPSNKLNTKKDFTRVVKNLATWAPKIELMINMLDGDKKNKEQQKKKHLVYSTFVKRGLMIAKYAMEARGYVDILDVIHDNKKWNTYEYKVFAVWDGKLKDEEKRMIKSLMNSKENVDGKYLRIILGSPSIKEGISFKHVQDMHILDPVWNQAAKDQLEGRVIRYCSHADVPENDKTLKRSVKIHYYIGVVPPQENKEKENEKNEATADQLIYDYIIPMKQYEVNKAENALKKVAFDYHLFTNKNKNAEESKEPELDLDEESDLELSTSEPYIKRKQEKTPKNTCPSSRRPDSDNKCADENHYAKVNKHGDPCCYKKTKKMLKNQTSSDT